jgi:hypothetical protein
MTGERDSGAPASSDKPQRQRSAENRWSAREVIAKALERVASGDAELAAVLTASEPLA